MHCKVQVVLSLACIVKVGQRVHAPKNASRSRVRRWGDASYKLGTDVQGSNLFAGIPAPVKDLLHFRASGPRIDGNHDAELGHTFSWSTKIVRLCSVHPRMLFVVFEFFKCNSLQGLGGKLDGKLHEDPLPGLRPCAKVVLRCLLFHCPGVEITTSKTSTAKPLFNPSLCLAVSVVP